MKNNRFVLALLFISIIYSPWCQAKGVVTINDLRVEMKVDPIGIGVTHPRLSWKLESSLPSVNQEAYQIIVAKSINDLKAEKNLVWNSGKVNSSSSIQIPYAGQNLQSNVDYYWKVKVFTNKGKSDWNTSGHWAMAFMNSTDWKADWIGWDHAGPKDSMKKLSRLSARYLRKEFKVEDGIKTAKLSICGLGLYECFINGVKVSRDIFAPSVTNYDKTVYYNVYDVSKYLKKDHNTIGIILGNGRYFSMRLNDDPSKNIFEDSENRHFGFPKLLMQLEIQNTNGKTEIVKSDDSWKITTDGPIVANNEYDGEEYNANLAFEGWNKNGFDDGQWKSVEVVKAPKGKLQAQNNPNIRIMDEVKPISIKALSEGKYIVDMGQNMVGWFAINHLKGVKDKPIHMRFAESLKSDGDIYTANLRSAKAEDIYTPNKDGIFSWQQTFTYHGFRYVEITGLDYIPSVNDFTGKVNYDQMRTIGSFECSDSTLNQIYHNAYWGIRGNYKSMPTDCPQRDERMGWLGDRSTGCIGESFIFDNALLYEKWMQDIEDSQLDNGAISDVSPNYWKVYNEDVTWPSTFILASNMLYRQNGDVRNIENHYDAMKHWVDHMQTQYMKDYIISKDSYGDWCMPPERLDLIHSEDPARITDGAILATSCFYNDLIVMSKFAQLTNHGQDSKTFLDLAAHVKEAYNNKFLNKEKGEYGNNTVTANLVSLMTGLVPEAYKSEVFNNVASRTEDEFKSHVSVGLIGIQYLMRGLSDYGRSDLALKIATNRSYPSWGYMIDQGATTIWELWNGNTADPSMNSRNHVMLLGDLITWYYEYLGGISSDKQDVGFKKIILKPIFPQGLNFVKVSHDSPYGMISSEWHRTENGKITWMVSIPANTTGVVELPSDSLDKLTEGGKTLGKNANITFVKGKNNQITFNIGSGEYKFEMKQ